MKFKYQSTTIVNNVFEFELSINAKIYFIMFDFSSGVINSKDDYFGYFVRDNLTTSTWLNSIRHGLINYHDASATLTKRMDNFEVAMHGYEIDKDFLYVEINCSGFTLNGLIVTVVYKE